jgi:Ig-like domain from next to BRCA1 gene
MLVRKFPRRILFILLTAALTLTACNVGATPAPTIDANAINTAAFNTAMAQIAAQQTQTALAAPSNTPLPTNTALSLATAAGASPTAGSGALPTVSFNITPNTTPLAGFTPLAGSPVAAGAATAALGDSCNNSAFVADVTIPDQSVLQPGRNFDKTWRLQNTGSCTWDDGYALVYIGGSTPNLDPYNFEFKESRDFVAGGNTADLTIELTTPCGPGKYEGHWRMRDDRGYYFGTIVSVYVEVTDRC